MQTRSSGVRIVFVAAHLTTRNLSSGGDVLFASIGREIARTRPGWQIAVIAPDYTCDGLSEFFRTVVPLPSTPSERSGLSHPRDVLAAWMKRVRPATEALLAIEPALVHTTGDFFVDVLAAGRLRHRSRCAWTGVVHHLNEPPLRRRNDVVAATGSYLLQAISLRALRAACDGISLLNAQTRDALLGRGFVAERLHIVGAGIETERFPPAPPPPAGKRVLWVHRLEPTKGIADLPKIAALLADDVTIDVVGGGPAAWRTQLQRDLAAAGNGARVALHGYVSDDDLHALYARANLFISCSYEEGWGISIGEALATGVPCVAYELPTYREVFGDLVETVPLGDVAAFAQRIAAVLARSDGPGARARRSAAAARHSMAAAAAKQAAVFDALLS